MSNKSLQATIQFRAVSAENEPLGEMVELGLDAAGFRDPRNAGGPGEKSEPLTLGQVAELLSSFEPQELDRLFTNLSDLRAFLSGTPSVSF